MSDSYDEAGLGDFLTFACDNKVIREVLDRSDFAVCVMFKGNKDKSVPGGRLSVSFKAPPGMFVEGVPPKEMTLAMLDLFRERVESA